MKSLMKLTIAAGILLVSAQANAIISLTPTICSANLGTACWTTDDTGALDGLGLASLVGYTGILDLAYKDNVGGSEEGSFASVYDTAFANSSSDPQDATITFTGSAGQEVDCPACFLVIKDGNQRPAQYVFDLDFFATDDAWDGVETISATGFWPNQGAISHVAIFNGEPIPEPGILALLSIGIVGIAVARRFKA